MQSQITDKPTSGSGTLGTPDLIAVRKFRADVGTHASTIWRWIKRGWLAQPINIAGRLYLSREQIEEFKRRAAGGEFARPVRPPALAKRGITE